MCPQYWTPSIGGTYQIGGFFTFHPEFLPRIVQILRNALFQDAAFGTGEDGHALSLFSQKLLLKIPQHDAVPDLFRGDRCAHMGIQNHGVVPVEAAEGIGGIGIDAHFVENIGADLNLPGFAAQKADTFIKVHLHFVIFGPIFYGVLHGNTVGDVAESPIEFVFLLRREDIAVDLNVHFTLALVFIEKGNVVHELLIIQLMTGKVPVLLRVDALHGNIQPVKARIQNFQTPLGSQQGSVGGGIHPQHFGRLLGIAHHVREPGIYQGFPLLVEPDHPDGIGELLQTVDDALVDLNIHRAVAPAPGLFHQLRIAGRTEFAAEIAGVAGIDVDHIGRPQRQGIF